MVAAEENEDEASVEMPPKTPTWDEIQELLVGEDDGSSPAGICALYRAIFGLRQAAPSVTAAISVLARALRQVRAAKASGFPSCFRFSSVLFRHECCYLLGQMGADCDDEQEAYACLSEVLLNGLEDEVTRHEAAEGIAAVHAGSVDSEKDLLSSEVFEILERLSSQRDSCGPLAETCYLAVEGMRRRGATRVCACQYASHDPALGDPEAELSEAARYGEVLKEEKGDLFRRYEAMFTLRNLGVPEALASVLDSDHSSVVLRHELAFVLGQMESDIAICALARSLGKAAEHPMVRHESAIALGSIGGADAKAALRKFSADPEP
eukprot:CAMPEP_0115605008 /NCGR_PEP_ID=MMETSP0272-20121206/17238_1 /TAXON_ID=71861 /ORGANISM="Scrippsiella trochoidea, Strain CCMP3099" /LENGTH=322 /DNA_ID=CAMNT_0003040581 /DNA_START=9 /DNA_END=973 /DNA_ORIENTATION=-